MIKHKRFKLPHDESVYTYIKIEDDRKDVPFLGMGDMHIGSPGCNLEFLREIVAWIKEHNAYWLYMGDGIECGLKSSPGASIWEQAMKPEEQIDTLLDMLDPIWEWCIGMLIGNHEFRVMKDTGLDPIQDILRAVNEKKKLKIPNCGWEAIGTIVRQSTKCTHATFGFYGAHSSTSNQRFLPASSRRSRSKLSLKLAVTSI